MYREKRFKDFRKKAKYNNTKCEYRGSTYHSKLEAKYAQDLDLRVKAKEILSWDRQVKIELDVNGYHICNYYIDFIARYPDGTVEYSEVKGLATEVWKLKWKLFEALYSNRELTRLTVVR